MKARLTRIAAGDNQNVRTAHHKAMLGQCVTPGGGSPDVDGLKQNDG